MNSVINWTSPVVISGDRFETEKNVAMNAFGDYPESGVLPVQKSAPYSGEVVKDGGAPDMNGNEMPETGNGLPPLVIANGMPISPSVDLGYVTPTLESPVESKTDVNEGFEEVSTKNVVTCPADNPGDLAVTQFSKDGSIRNMPGNMLPDQFGLAGFIVSSKAFRSGPSTQGPTPDSPEYDHVFQEIQSLATSSTANCLLLNFPGPLFNATEPASFCATPLVPLPDVPEYRVTQHMVTNCRDGQINILRNRFALRLDSYPDDTLFFLFYNFPQDLLQVMAAAYLYQKDWRYHMEDQVWLQRFQNAVYVKDPNNPSIERGLYKRFDPATWKPVSVELNLDRNKLEGAPSIPSGYFVPNS